MTREQSYQLKCFYLEKKKKLATNAGEEFGKNTPKNNKM